MAALPSNWVVGKSSHEGEIGTAYTVSYVSALGWRLGSLHLEDGTAAAAKLLQSCPTLCDPHRRRPTGLPCPWDSPGKNTGVGCHFLLQCMKGKSESEVAQLCPTLRYPTVCSLPGSSVHGIFQARVLEWGAIQQYSNFFISGLLSTLRNY